MPRTLLRRSIREDDGATAAEYAVMLALIIVAVISAVFAVGNSTADGWNGNVRTIRTAILRASGS